MANIYVRSTDGNNADSGATWALAKATVAGALAIASSGDTIYVSQVHAETAAAATTWSCNFNVANPVKIICVNDAAEPPTTVATTGSVTTTGANGITVQGVGGLYVYGLTFNCGTGAVRADLSLGLINAANALSVVYESCSFILVNTNASSGIYPTDSTASTGTAYAVWINCNVKFAATGSTLRVTHGFRWTGGSVLSGSAALTNFMFAATLDIVQAGGPILVEDVDLSNFSSAVNIVVAPSYSRSPFTIRNCKLPAAWAGSLVSGSVGINCSVVMDNCDSGATNYKKWVETYGGQLKQETTVVRTNGASDGVTPLSWKVISSGNAGYLGSSQFRAGEIVLYNTTTGSSKTATVEILRDSLTNLTEAEIWLEISYLGSSATPLGTLITDAPATPITTAADQASSTAAWTTTGIANPNKQKVSVTFTPQMIGFYLCTVVLAKASTTVYIDPKVTIT